MACSATLWISASCFSWSLKGTGCPASEYRDQNTLSVELFPSLRKNAAASDALRGRSKNAPRELRIRVSNRYFTFMFLLCIENVLPAAIFLISSNSWRALWASALAFLVVSTAEASSVACAFTSSSKPSCFSMRACSFCCTSPYWPPSFSRSVRSSAAFFSASASACLRVSTSVVTPTIGSSILLFFAIKPLYRHILLLRGLSYLPSPRDASWQGRALARTARSPFQDFHLRS